MANKCFLYVDIDAFFASVEQLDHPEWKGKPVIVGGLPEERRSVVSTASYEARKFGVHSAMPTAAAYRLCPEGIFTHGNMKRYSEISEVIMEILSGFSPDVEQRSIDEACVELTGTEKLFGRPEETARKIKKLILDATGLTVSCGLASTRYLSKIASEINKPDGLFIIPDGKEQDFMLSLPLKKVWGIGEKTLERLNKAGFFTTRQIFGKKKELLCIAFGEGTGSFLYNTVRGIETEHRTVPTHSISNETTFPFDLTDIYTAETAIMELCHCIMFRLLREKSFSRTVMVKIRYEDFSTITVQETSSEYITSADDLYQRSCRLFEKKFDASKGIRLLGIGVENIEETPGAKQEMLFDFGEKKKQAVENAILSIKNKHPEIEIKKARLISTSDSNKSLLIILFCLLSVFSGMKDIKAQESREIHSTSASGAGTISLPSAMPVLPFLSEAPASLFNYTVNDNEIEFFAHGWWQAEVSGTTGFSFGKNTSSTGSAPVFKQEVDLSMWFMLNRQWYFKTSFADEFSRNTVSAGFYGKPSDTLQEIKISNRGIIFPSGYSIDSFNQGIGGGENQAPGIYVHLQDSGRQIPRWKSDIAVRYDMTEQKSASFYGKNSVRKKKISLSGYIDGQFFYLPSEELAKNLINVYVENTAGEYSDSDGRKYKKLPADEYFVTASKKSVILSKDAGSSRKNGKLPYVAFEFSQEINSQTEFGSYDDGQTFLGSIQEYFSSGAHKINLQKYSYPLVKAINGKQVVIVQSPSGFSPFIGANIYDCGISDNPDVIIASEYTEEQNAGYSAIITDAETAFASDNFFYEKHILAEISHVRTEPNTSGSGNSASYDTIGTSPEARYPFADKNPLVYLAPDSTGSDLTILVKNYTPVSRYDIGTNVSAGSVKVYRNGILDTGAKYEPESGTVIPGTSVSDYDKIYIIWQEDSADSKRGSVAAQAAFMYSLTKNISADISAAAVWPVSTGTKYAEYEKPITGYAALSAGIKYDGENINISNAASFSAEASNTTGIYRIAGFDDTAPSTTYAGQNSGFFQADDTPPYLNSRDYSSATALSALNNKIIKSDSRDGLKDSGISGYKIPLAFDFSGETSGLPDAQWAAVNIKLENGSSLASATEFRLALKNEDGDGSGGDIFSEYDVYVQLGTEASDSPDRQEATLVPTWLITGGNTEDVPNAFSPELKKNGRTDWQTVRILLKNEDRAKLTQYKDLRIITVSKPGGKGTGKLCAGPYEIIKKGIFTSSSIDFNLTSEQEKDNSIKKDYDQDSDNYIQKITWRYDSTSTPETKSFIAAAKYINETDISPYSTLKFDFKFTKSSEQEATEGSWIEENITETENAFIFTMDRNALNIDEDGISTAVRIKINCKEMTPFFSSTSASYHTFEADLIKKNVRIDGRELSKENTEIYINTDIVPSRMKIEFLPVITGQASEHKKIVSEGDFFIDELRLDGSSPYFLLQNTAKILYEKKGGILKAGNFPLISDVSFYSKTTTNMTVQTNSSIKNEQTITNSTSADITVATIKFHTDTGFSSGTENALTSAGHKINTTVPLFGFISAADEFVYISDEKSAEKAMSAGLNLNRIHIPFTLSASANSRKNTYSHKQGSAAKAEIQTGSAGWNLNIFTSAEFAQKKQIFRSDSTDKTKNDYFTSYKEATEDLFSAGEYDADSRNVKFSAGIQGKLPPAALSPALRFAADGKYTSSSEVIFSDTTTIQAEIPFKIKKNSFSFKYTREGGEKSQFQQGGSYQKDTQTLFDSLKNRSYYFTSVPFYELFCSPLPDNISERYAEYKTQSISYSGTYNFSWKRQLCSNTVDLFLPSSFDFSAARKINVSDTESDIYLLKTTIINTPFNLFGSQSALSIFRWYNTDEYAFSFTGTAKIPSSSPSDSIYTLSFYAQGGFYIKNSDILKIASQLKIETDSSWNNQYTVLYKRECKTSPVISFIKIFANERVFEKITGVKLYRTNSLDIVLNYSSEKEILTRKYELSHKIDAKIKTYLSVYTGISAAYSVTQNSVSVLNLTASAGGKLEF